MQRQGIVRRQFQQTVEQPQGLARALKKKQRAGLIEQREIVLGIDDDRLLVALQGLVVPSKAAKHPAPVSQDVGMARLGFQRAVKMAQGFGGIILLRLKHPEKMQCDQIAAIAGHDLGAKLVRPGEIAELIGRHRFGQ